MRRRAAAFDAVLRWLILLVAFGAPLALGTVHQWPLAALQWLALVLLLVWILKAAWIPPLGAVLAPSAAPAAPGRGPRLLGHRLTATGLGLPVALFIILVLVQMLPLPAVLVGLLAPGTAALNAASLPGLAGGDPVDFASTGTFLLGDQGEAVVERILEAPGSPPEGLELEAPRFRPMSIYPYATVSRLLLLLALCCIFVVALHVFTSPERIRWLLRATVLFGFGLALFGILQRLSWNGKIYWTLPVEATASPFGPFINHNHFAALMALIVPIAVGMLMDQARRRFPGRSAPAGDGGPDPLARLLLSAFAVGVMASSVVLSSSRGAVLSLLIALVLYGGILALRGRMGRPEALVAAVLVLAALALSLWLGLGPLAGKLRAIGDVESEPSLFTRLLGYGATLEIVKSSPLVGTGLGTFPQAWRHVYPPGTVAVWHEAHNDYLQLLAEAGIVGFLIFLAALAIFARRYLLWGLLDRQGFGSYALHGVAVGIIAVALHSLVDFPLQIAGCSVLFVVLSAAIVSWRRQAMEVAA